MGLTRTPHWETKDLHEWLLAHANDPFAWGTNDCCLAPANAILSFTGTDLAAAFRGKYHDRASAFTLIHSVTGGSSVADAAAWCAAQHGLAEWAHPLLAQRGDLVVVNAPSDDGSLLAGFVHLNGRHVITTAEAGLIRLPASAIVRAWKV